MRTSEFIDKLAADNGYLKPIECENCGYKGKPHYDGTCPTCGSICGIKPTEMSAARIIDDLYEQQLESDLSSSVDKYQESMEDWDLLL